MTCITITDSPAPNPSYHPGVFKFDGQTFTPVGKTQPPPWTGQFSWVDDLRVFDDGRGPALYVGGGFNQFGLGSNIISARGIVRWDGQTFEPLGAGGTQIWFLGEVQAGFGRSLFVGQENVAQLGGGLTPGSGLWVTCPICYANCDDSEVEPRLNIADFTCFLQKYARKDPYANCTVDAEIDIADFQCFLQRFAAGCP